MRRFVSGGNTWSRASLPCVAWEGTEGAFYAGWWSAGSYLLALIFKRIVHQISFHVSLKRIFWHFELGFINQTFFSFCALLWRWSISWWYQSKLSYTWNRKIYNIKYISYIFLFHIWYIIFLGSGTFFPHHWEQLQYHQRELSGFTCYVNFTAIIIQSFNDYLCVP